MTSKHNMCIFTKFTYHETIPQIIASLYSRHYLISIWYDMYTTYVYSDYITLKSSCCVCISITSTSMARPGDSPHMSTPGFQTPTSRGSNTHWACVCENHPLGPWRWVFCLEILWWKDSPAKSLQGWKMQASLSRWPRFFFSCNVFQVITGSTHLVSEFKTHMGLHCQDPSKHYQVFQESTWHEHASSASFVLTCRMYSYIWYNNYIIHVY